MANLPEYVELSIGADLPQLRWEPSRVVVILDRAVEPSWKERASEWFISIGCLYMMAWGEGCSTWDDSVDYANVRAFIPGDIPEDRAVMTTWHEREELSEVFRFSKKFAFHPTVELTRTVLVNVGTGLRRADLLAQYADA